MLCDHANFLVIRRGVFAPYPAADGSILIPADAPAGVLLVQRVYGIFEILGHIGFPIFIFLLTRPDGTRPLLIAVTQLTSTDQDMLEKELWIEKPMEEVVLHYAEIASIVGLDGVVCSPLEAGSIHERCGKNFLTVTPGVRFAGGDAGDQKRITTPAKARELGSDYIVVGRPITQAADPVAAYRRCVAEFVG